MSSIRWAFVPVNTQYKGICRIRINLKINGILKGKNIVRNTHY